MVGRRSILAFSTTSCQALWTTARAWGLSCQWWRASPLVEAVSAAQDEAAADEAIASVGAWLLLGVRVAAVWVWTYVADSAVQCDRFDRSSIDRSKLADRSIDRPSGCTDSRRQRKNECTQTPQKKHVLFTANRTTTRPDTPRRAFMTPSRRLKLIHKKHPQQAQASTHSFGLHTCRACWLKTPMVPIDRSIWIYSDRIHR